MQINQTAADGVVEGGGTLHAVRTILSNEIATDTVPSAARVFKDPPVVNWKDTDGTITQNGNTIRNPPRSTTPVLVGAGPFVYPTKMGSQNIGVPRGSISPQEVRNAQLFDTSINGFFSEHRDPALTLSNAISRKFSNESSADIYLSCRMNLTRNTVLAKSPNFMNLGLSSVHTLDELRSVFITTTRIIMLAYGSNWLPPGHRIGKVTADRVIRTQPEKNYNPKSYFETNKGGVVNQDFGRQNNSMSRPTLDSTPLGTNTNNGTTTPIDLIPVETKSPYPMPLILTTYFPEQNGKLHVPGDPDPDASLSYSSCNKYNLLNDSNSSKSNKKKRDKKKRHWKDKKHDSSGSSSSVYDSSNDSDYRCKLRKKNSHQKKDPIKLCSRLTAKLLTTTYKSKITKFKLDEDPLQRRIYYITFVESMDMIFSQYKETYEVLIDYPKIGGENIKDLPKYSVRNLLHANIDVRSRRLISEFPGYGIKCIEKLQSHFFNVTFSYKSRYDRIFRQITYKGGESAMNYIDRFHLFPSRWNKMY